MPRSPGPGLLLLLAMAVPDLAAAQDPFHPMGRTALAHARFTVRIEPQAAAAPAQALWVLHDRPDPLFTAGQRDRGAGLEALVEDGDGTALVPVLRAEPGIAEVGLVAAGAAGAREPSGAMQFDLVARPGDRLSLVLPYPDGNDLFIAAGAAGLRLFDDAGVPMIGEVTTLLQLWDLGTEVNEAPGRGVHQAPRQAAPGAGTREARPVAAPRDRARYPGVPALVRVTVRAAAVPPL